MRYRQARLLGWNSLPIQQPPTRFKALISLLDSLPDFPLNSVCEIRRIFNTSISAKRETNHQIQAVVQSAMSLVQHKALWLFFKARVIQGIFLASWKDVKCLSIDLVGERLVLLMRRCMKIPVSWAESLCPPSCKDQYPPLRQIHFFSWSWEIM